MATLAALYQVPLDRPPAPPRVSRRESVILFPKRKPAVAQAAPAPEVNPFPGMPSGSVLHEFGITPNAARLTTAEHARRQAVAKRYGATWCQHPRILGAGVFAISRTAALKATGRTTHPDLAYLQIEASIANDLGESPAAATRSQVRGAVPAPRRRADAGCVPCWRRAGRVHRGQPGPPRECRRA
jgi:hypothetical protein